MTGAFWHGTQALSSPLGGGAWVIAFGSRGDAIIDTRALGPLLQGHRRVRLSCLRFQLGENTRAAEGC
jgi:hypothetical protein